MLTQNAPVLHPDAVPPNPAAPTTRETASHPDDLHKPCR
jgi:hypothetical protein